MTFNFSNNAAFISTSGYFQLEFDGTGVSPSYVKSVDGGYPKANTVEEQIGQDLNVIKHISTVEIEPLSIEMGMQAGLDVLGWIQESWRREFGRRTGCLTHGNFNAKSTLEHHFHDALITETTFPELDAAGKQVAFLKFKIQPERVEFKQSGGETLQAPMPGKQKLWTSSSFRFTLDGVDTSNVSKVESFTVTQGVKALFTGQDRFPQWEPTKISFPDLTIHMSQRWAGPVMSWYDDFVIKGHQDPKAEKNGSIEFLAPNLRDVVYRINLYNVGIKSYATERAQAAEDQMKKVKFELYVGRMDLDGDGALALE